MKHAFKTPGLREIARRSPFMHDGSIATLEQVVEHYDQGGAPAEPLRPRETASVSRHRRSSELVAFLKTLTSHLDPTTVPVLPR